MNDNCDGCKKAVIRKSYPPPPLRNSSIFKFNLLLFLFFLFAFSGPPLSLVQAAIGDTCGIQNVDICIMMDRTGSVEPEGRTNEVNAVYGLIDQIAAINPYNGTRVSIGRFGGNNNVNAEIIHALGPLDTPEKVTQIKTSISNGMSSSSSVGTNIQTAIKTCQDNLTANGNTNTKIIILLSDGDPSECTTNINPNNTGFPNANDACSIDQANKAKALGIRIFTISFDNVSASNADEDNRNLMAKMASGNELDDFCTSGHCNATDWASENADGGDYFISPITPGELTTIFNRIFQVIQCADDGNACTVESCNNQTHQCESAPISNCVPCQNNSQCNDNNSCTNDSCVSGRCQYAPVTNGTSCSDGNACTTGEVCTNGQCGGGSPVTCNDNISCTDDSCNAQTGCIYTPNSTHCNDGRSCSSDTCDPQNQNADPISGCMIDKSQCACSSDSECPSDNPCKVGRCNMDTGTCYEENKPDNTSCEDGLFCNGADTCQSGQCTGHAGNPCTAEGICKTCNEETDQCAAPAGTTCEDDGNGCTDNKCDGEGNCVATNNTASCNDGSACTTVDVCSNGSCQGTTPLNCDDGIACTDDSCNAQNGCEHIPNSTHCNDGRSCSTDSCDPQNLLANPQTGCINDITACQCSADSDCPSNDPCKVGRCNVDTGTCFTENAEDGARCDDDLFCNGADSCQSGQCTGHTGDPCMLSGICNTCNENSKSCFANEGTACEDDSNGCTDNKCDGEGNCVATNNTASCNDDSVCTTVDTCSNGSCQGSSPLNCDDSIACTDDTCDTKNGCQHTPNSNLCNDGRSCSNDSCDPQNPNADPQTGCFFDASQCGCSSDEDCPNNGNSCQTPRCNVSAGTCFYEDKPDNTSCEDGLFCNGADTCQSGQCTGHAGNPCTAEGICKTCNEETDQCAAPAGTTCEDDGNGCTDNKCDGEGNCVATNNTASCNDGSACTTVDVCSNGSCQGTTPLNCDDGIACTDDSCNAQNGCEHTPNNSNCANEGSSCIQMTCDPLNPLADSQGCFTDTSSCQCFQDSDCPAAEVGSCKVGLCDTSTGTCFMGNKEDNSSCDDGNPCTVNEVCSAGECGGGTPKSCDDGNFCNGAEICNPNTPNGCQAGTPPSCNDQNSCTEDTCDPTLNACKNADNGSCKPPPCADQDRDGICDKEDNCPDTANPDQKDSNQNGIGDTCEKPGQGGSSGHELEGSGTIIKGCALSTSAAPSFDLIGLYGALFALLGLWRFKYIAKRRF